MKEMPNIVLIMTDEMRGDCMGVAGHPDVKTPYLDSLAKDGVYFPHAYSSCPSCVPARAVLHTGRSPRGCGRVGYQDKVEWNYEHTLAGELTKTGYYTQCVGKMHVHPVRNYLGFHNVELHDGYLHQARFMDIPYSENLNYIDDYLYWLKSEKGVDCDVWDTGLDCNSWMARPWMYEEKYHPTNWVTNRSIDFLRRRDKRQPFFLMASYVRPHAPYDAPSYYFDMYKDKELAKPVYGDWEDNTLWQENGNHYQSFTGPVDAELIRQQMIGYYACISHVDNQIGKLILALTEHKVMDNTIIIFTSDHGELLSDHYMVRKSRPYQGSIHIPMIISGPQHLIGEPNRVEDSLVELRDVMSTMLSAANATDSTWEMPDYLEGEDMLSSVKREYLHGEHSFAELSNHFIVTKEDKYIWYSQTGKEEYFRLLEDPKEKHNAILDEEFKERIAYLKTCLIKELEGREEGYTDGTSLIIKRPVLNCLTS